MGTPIYSYDSTGFLDSGNLKKRFLFGFNFNKVVKSKYGAINYNLKIENIESENVYDNNKIINCQLSILYNINY